MKGEQQEQIASLTELRDAGILDENVYQAAVAGIAYRAEASRGSTVAQGIGTTAVGSGGVNVPGTVHGNIYAGEPTDDPAEALRVYREVLLAGSSYLPLRGVDVGAGDPAAAKQLGLANVYVDLDTVRIIGGSSADGGSIDWPDEPQIVHVRLLRLTALEAVSKNRRVILTGEPGSGKSTFVNHLAYCLAAHALYPDAGWLAHLPEWPESEGSTLPLLITLRDFPASMNISERREARANDLWRFITQQLEEQNLEFAAKAIEGELQQGRVMVLLDGLDEVIGEERRGFVRDTVAALAERYPASRFVVTCRVLSYHPPDEGKPDLRLDATQFPVFELAPFDEIKINRFIDAWYVELSRLGSVRAQDIDTLVSRLKTEVRRPDLWRMASNPLLLTVMTLVDAHHGRLPDGRAHLYEQTVDMLLWRWEEVKVSRPARVLTLRQLLQDAGRAELDLKRVLWQLAYEAHGRSGAGTEALGSIAESQLTRALIRLKPDDWQWAHEMMAAMKLRAGLLLERSPGVFTFPHRTFQEFLAGAHLSTQSDCAQRAAKLGEQGPLWREVILLAVGRLVYVGGDVDRALAAVNRLCPERAGDNEMDGRNAWLAGDALREIGLQRTRDDEWGQELLQRVGQRLSDIVTRGQLSPRERAAAGETLGELGDSRPGVGVRNVGDEVVPDIELSYVPAGAFWMGSPEGDVEAQRDEWPLHQVDIPYGYWIGRYMITVGQWRAFCKATDYRPYDRYSLIGVANGPAIWILWYDAIAFCHWLTEIGLAAGWLLDGWKVSLPLETEWEKASRGGIELPETLRITRLGESLAGVNEERLVGNSSPKRRFPWGDEPADPERANYNETGIGRPCSTGAFPGGAGPYGTLDLSGNVWEWTRSRYELYRDDPASGHEVVDVAAGDVPVVRGGAYYSKTSRLRCAVRSKLNPSGSGVYGGFRVVISPFPPPLDSGSADL